MSKFHIQKDLLLHHESSTSLDPDCQQSVGKSRSLKSKQGFSKNYRIKKKIDIQKVCKAANPIDKSNFQK